MNIYHVLPLDDLYLHIEAETCPCLPKIELVEDKGKVVIHHAWDEREKYEQVEAVKGHTRLL